jgi:predicted dehydrogenase
MPIDQATTGFGLVGLGAISRAHLQGYRNATAHAHVAAVCDLDRALAQRVGHELGARSYNNYAALLRDPEVQAVDIMLPHNLHYAVGRRALESGKHVIIEKPLAPTVDECESLIELARGRGLLLSVSENARFVKAYVEVEKLLRQGALGSPRLIRTLIYGSELNNLTNHAHWRARAATSLGGAIIDSSPHSFYLLKWLFGEIEVLRAFTDKLVGESEVEDNALVTGRMKSGALFTAQFTFTAEIPWGERLEVYGSEGTIIVDQLRDPPAVHFRGKTDLIGRVLSDVPFDPAGWKFGSIATSVAEFAAAVGRKAPPPIDPLEARYVMLVIEKCYESVRASGQPVHL